MFADDIPPLKTPMPLDEAIAFAKDLTLDAFGQLEGPDDDSRPLAFLTGPTLDGEAFDRLDDFYADVPPFTVVDGNFNHSNVRFLVVSLPRRKVNSSARAGHVADFRRC